MVKHLSACAVAAGFDHFMLHFDSGSVTEQWGDGVVLVTQCTVQCLDDDRIGGVASDSPLLEIHTQPFLSQHLHTECISIRNILRSCISKIVPCHV